MVRTSIAALICQAVLVQCKPQEGSHVDPASLVDSINGFMASSHTTPSLALSQNVASVMPPVGFADVSAPQALAALQSDASAADQGTNDAISDFLGGLASDVPTPQPLVPEVVHHVKSSAESIAQLPKYPLQLAAAKVREAPSTTPSPEKTASTTRLSVTAVQQVPLEIKVDRAQLKKEMRAELKDELTREILEEEKHKDSAGKTAEKVALVQGHGVSRVSPVAPNKAPVARAKQSHAKVAVESKIVTNPKKAGVGTKTAVKSKTAASLLKTAVATKKEASHATIAAHSVKQVSSAEQNRESARQAHRLEVTFDTKAAALTRKIAPLKAAEDWFGTASVPSLEHQKPKHASLASTGSKNTTGLDQHIHDLQGELHTEQTLRKEAAEVAAKKTGRPEVVWSPAAQKSSVLGNQLQQVDSLEAKLKEERRLREEAAEAADSVAPTAALPEVPMATATTTAPASPPPTPKGLSVLPWPHAAASHPVLGAIVGDRPLAKDSAPQGFFAAAHKPPQGLLAAVRNSFEWVTGGRFQWLLVDTAPKAAQEAAKTTPEGSSVLKPMRLGHSLQFPSTRRQDFAKVAAATLRDKLQSISLGATFLEMEDRDAVDEDNLKHADAYERSTAEKAEAPHVMSEQERADRRKESVHISDVWLNLEQQDSDIEQTLDNMGPDTNLNKMGDLDSIQDQSMAALTRQVDAAGDNVHDSQHRILSNVVSSDFVHEPFEQLQISDEDAEKRIKLDPSMRRE